MPRRASTEPLHVCIVAIPEAVVSTLSGIYDVMNVFAMTPIGDIPVSAPPFRVEIVGHKPGPLDLVSGMPITVQRRFAALDTTDIIIVPSILLGPDGWRKDRHPELVDLAARHASPRRAAVLGLFRDFPARRNRIIRSHGCDGAFWLRPRIRRHVSGKCRSIRSASSSSPASAKS